MAEAARTMSLLAVGGRESGKRFTLYDGQDYLRVSYTESGLTFWALGPAEVPETVEVHFTLYQRQLFRGNSQFFYLLVPAEQTPDETMMLLLESFEKVKRG